jgi:hypothetical protein
MSITDKLLFGRRTAKERASREADQFRHSREARFEDDVPGGPNARAHSGMASAVVGALAVRHGVEAFTLLLFVHTQADREIDQLERDRRDDA